MIPLLIIGIVLAVCGALLSVSQLEPGLTCHFAFRRPLIWVGLGCCLLGAVLILSLLIPGL